MIISSISRDSFKIRQLEEQRPVSTAAAIKQSGTADTMVGQKSGPALAGPAAPATTALCRGIHVHVPFFFIFAPKHKLWVLVRAASARRFYVLSKNSNLCFEQK